METNPFWETILYYKTSEVFSQIKIGNLKSDVGYLNYYEVEEIGKPIAVGIILGVVLPILAIIVLLTICVIRRHRKHGPSENYIPDVLKDYEGKKEEEDIGMNHVSTVKADMNGQIPDNKGEILFCICQADFGALLWLIS